MIASTYTTIHLISMYPDLPMPNTPWSVKHCWDKWYAEWMRELPPVGKWVAPSAHAKLLRVRDVLLKHHDSLHPSDKKLNRR